MGWAFGLLFSKMPISHRGGPGFHTWLCSDPASQCGRQSETVIMAEVTDTLPATGERQMGTPASSPSCRRHMGSKPINTTAFLSLFSLSSSQMQIHIYIFSTVYYQNWIKIELCHTLKALMWLSFTFLPSSLSPQILAIDHPLLLAQSSAAPWSLVSLAGMNGLVILRSLHSRTLKAILSKVASPLQPLPYHTATLWGLGLFVTLNIVCFFTSLLLLREHSFQPGKELGPVTTDSQEYRPQLKSWI